MAFITPKPAPSGASFSVQMVVLYIEELTKGEQRQVENAARMKVWLIISDKLSFVTHLLSFLPAFTY
jgi:hypothetical protein